MRATSATIVGLIAGGLLGFALRGLAGDDGPPSETPSATRAGSSDAASPALPAVTPAPAERLEPAVAAPASLSAVTADGSSGSASGAADALVGILVYGAVLDEAGSRAKLGDVRWMGFDSDSGAPRSVEVAKDSTYAIAGLQPGRCTVRTNFYGYRPWTRELTLEAGQPAVRLDIVLQPSVTLMVKAFTPSGELLIQALASAMGVDGWSVMLAAIATRQPPPARLPEISQRGYDQWEIGYFTGGRDLMMQDDALPKDALGKLELDESLPAFVSLMFQHVVVQTQTVEPGATEVVFVVPIENLTALLGGVRVKVVDAGTRQPIEGATAELSDSQSGAGNHVADATGVFAWDKQKPGLLELQIAAPGHEQWDGEVSVPSGAVADLGTLELTPATSVRGIVLDQAGRPVSIGLRALPEEERELGMGARRYNKSGADGSFEWKTLGRRRYRLVVSDNDWAGLPVAVDLSQGDVEGVVLRVAPGMLVRLRTRWPAGESYGVRVLSKEGVVVSDSDAWRGDWAWGKRLLPGDYVAILLREGKELKRADFKVGNADVAVELAP